MSTTLGVMSLTARQTEFADAALRVIARDGLPGASFRAVATEAGRSLGSLQKAFPTKEQLMSAAFSRLRERAAPAPPGEPGRPTLHNWLVELLIGILPLDEERLAAQRQGDAFAQHALSDKAIGAAIADSDAEVRGLLMALIARSRAEGEVPAHVDPDTTAWALLALAQGIASQLLYRPEGEAEVRQRVDQAVRALLR